jgi:pimeloyl-ACP methyl ester carboxylesterase
VVTQEVAAGYQQQLQIVGWDEAMIDIVAGRGMADAPLTEAEIAAFTSPVLIVWGDNDTWVPIASGQRLADVLDDEQFVTFSETGHMPMEERPARFNEVLLEFLNAGMEQ